MAAKNSTGRSAASKAANRSTATRSQGGKKKTSAKTATAKRKYSPEASAYVGEELKEMKQGKLKSGGDGKKVRNPKQAIAIGLSKARKAGAKVPKTPRSKAA